MATLFLLDEQTKEWLKDLREYAEKIDHWYVPGKTPSPGLNRKHVMQSMDIQACFSWTLAPDKKLFRHLSVSTRAWHLGNRKSFPLPQVGWTIAHHLGYTGGVEDRGIITAPSPDWVVGLNKDEGTLVGQQKVQEQ